jgi:hypothetical protein
MLNDIEKHPVETYQTLLLNHLIKIYTARKKTTRTDWTKYSDLLIDKFAIHSSTLFHLINGLVENKNSEPTIRKVPFDLFSINALIRVLIETYITFNHVFVSSKSNDEMELHFLLWQADGLLEQRKFRINDTDFDGAEKVLNDNQQKIDNLFDQIERMTFYKSLSPTESHKIFDRSKNKVNWKYRIEGSSVIKPMNIIELVEYVCVSRSFVNLYKYTSTHTHSGFISIEHFEKMRGSQVSDNYVNPLITQAIVLTIFLINDICLIDPKAQKAFLAFSDRDRHDIIGINNSFRKIQASRQ